VRYGRTFSNPTYRFFSPCTTLITLKPIAAHAPNRPTAQQAARVSDENSALRTGSRTPVVTHVQRMHILARVALCRHWGKTKNPSNELFMPGR
jgi:hypothetical protein